MSFKWVCCQRTCRFLRMYYAPSISLLTDPCCYRYANTWFEEIKNTHSAVQRTMTGLHDLGSWMLRSLQIWTERTWLPLGNHTGRSLLWNRGSSPTAKAWSFYRLECTQACLNCHSTSITNFPARGKETRQHKIRISCPLQPNGGFGQLSIVSQGNTPHRT